VTDLLPEEAYAIALSSLPNVGPAKLRGWLCEGTPSGVWAAAPEEARVAGIDVTAVWQRHLDLGVSVLLPGNEQYPERLRNDPQAPPILFCLGDPGALSGRPTVAIVGTRAPTRYGVGVAAQLGADLAAVGVSVVSGLALGIDTAAHEGACDAGAPPIGVVANGLDDPYPRRNARLWERVARAGAIVSEAPVGGGTEKWRFPVRNRLLASLSDVVVVVESRHQGGSRHTVNAAVARGISVGAVPGSIRSPNSEGTNALLGEGAFPVCSAGDILVALALEGATVPSPSMIENNSGVLLQEVSDRDRELYEMLVPDPTSLDDLARATGLTLPELCGGLERLAQAGLARDVGGWWERV
jgi:DNA processing protein